MDLKIHNTLSRTKEELKSMGEEFKMYCCGPTVYGPAHIGNFRTFVVQDTLRRTLEAIAVKVNHVRNITDVDDKTIRQSQAENMSLKDFTSKWTDKFHIDCDKLNMLRPSTEPKATEHIKEQIDMVSTLIEKGHAYAMPDGSVYFKISSFPQYGKLSGLQIEDLNTQKENSAGALNAADEYDRDSVSDFALWKGKKAEDGENAWQSPWGEGRPGWHIECSAMSRRYLGDTFDLHGGGVDLCFPHHENEVAQSVCTTGKDFYANYWFHSAHLMVESKKMSKSLGNLYTMDDLEGKGYKPMQIRLALLMGHYRQQLNFTFKGLDDAKSALNKLDKFIAKALEALSMSQEDFVAIINAKDFSNGAFDDAFEAMLDDLNIPKGLGRAFTTFANKDTFSLDDLKSLARFMYALGLIPFADKEECSEIPQEILDLAEARWQAKKNKDWAKADEIRKALQEKSWNVLDNKDGYSVEKI
ncbi:MAG: cysteine--tRNA ligase [Opitutales bacterium]